jgi:hypothetical protein
LNSGARLALRAGRDRNNASAVPLHTTESTSSTTRIRLSMAAIAAELGWHGALDAATGTDRGTFHAAADIGCGGTFDAAGSRRGRPLETSRRRKIPLRHGTLRLRGCPLHGNARNWRHALRRLHLRRGPDLLRIDAGAVDIRPRIGPCARSGGATWPLLGSAFARLELSCVRAAIVARERSRLCAAAFLIHQRSATPGRLHSAGCALGARQLRRRQVGDIAPHLRIAPVAIAHTIVAEPAPAVV